MIQQFLLLDDCQLDHHFCFRCRCLSLLQRLEQSSSRHQQKTATTRSKAVRQATARSSRRDDRSIFRVHASRLRRRLARHSHQPNARSSSSSVRRARAFKSLDARHDAAAPPSTSFFATMRVVVSLDLSSVAGGRRAGGRRATDARRRAETTSSGRTTAANGRVLFLRSRGVVEPLATANDARRVDRRSLSFRVSERADGHTQLLPRIEVCWM